MGKKPIPVADRFWPKVDRRGPDECWNWIASSTRQGYGVIGIGPHSIETAHRVSWALANGLITDGLWVLHKCDNRKCVNPNHLYLGTVKENARDLIERGKPYHEIRKHITPDVELKRIAALPRGANHHRSNAKLSEDQVREILDATGSQKAIAEQYGVCQQLISRIKRRTLWEHI